MKVALLNDSFPPVIDGVSICVCNYARIIKRDFDDCVVVTPAYPNAIDNYDFDVYRYRSFDIAKKLSYRVGNIASPKTLVDMKRYRPELLHVHSPFASSILANELNHTYKRLPTILTYHTKFDIDLQYRLSSPSLRSIALKLIRHNLKRADEVWVVSEGAKESLYQVGYRGESVVMQNGTDFDKGRAEPAAVDKLKLFHDIDDIPVFLYVGRMMWYKNIKLLLDALALLKDMPFKALFVGDGLDRHAMEQYAAEKGISDKCEFTGAVYDRERIRAYFTLANLFLFPSTYDTAGLVVMEAAACECPSLLIEKSCASERIIHGKNGLLCAENERVYADMIREASTDLHRLRVLGKAAQDTVYYSWDDAVAQAYRRYLQVLHDK